MPTYTITDPDTGRSIRITGDGPPTEAELDEIFASVGGSTPSGGGGMSTAGALGAGAVGLGGLALLASVLKKGPGAMKAVGTGLEYANAARMQSMLSGLALPKSMLGGAGAAVERGIETGSLRPLKEMFSRQTLRDAGAAYRQNAGPVGASATAPRGVTLPGPMPGRIMGAFDDAAQGALRRSGASFDEAENAMLQSPLTGKLAEALDNPAARYLHPFRRTPFNQFFEGLKRLPGGPSGSARGKAVYMGTGAVHGAATADEDYPVSVPLAMAGSARYGMPYGVGAFIGRKLAGGSGGGGISGGMLPVSEYGTEQSLTQPLKPFTHPAWLTALERLLGK